MPGTPARPHTQPLIPARTRSRTRGPSPSHTQRRSSAPDKKEQIRPTPIVALLTVWVPACALRARGRAVDGGERPTLDAPTGLAHGAWLSMEEEFRAEDLGLPQRPQPLDHEEVAVGQAEMVVEVSD